MSQSNRFDPMLPLDENQIEYWRHLDKAVRELLTEIQTGSQNILSTSANAMTIGMQINITLTSFNAEHPVYATLTNLQRIMEEETILELGDKQKVIGALQDFIELSNRLGLQVTSVEQPMPQSVTDSARRTIKEELNDAILHLSSPDLQSSDKLNNSRALLNDISKNNFPIDRSGLQIIMNAAVGDPVDLSSLAKMLRQSGNDNKNERKIYRQIASLQNPEDINKICKAIQILTTNLKNEYSTITVNTKDHEIIPYNLAHISDRNDEAGVLQRKTDYLNNHRNHLYKDFLENNSEVSAKYKEAKNLADSLTIRLTKIDVLNNLEYKLNDLKKHNDSLDSLRSKKALFRSQPKPYELMIKNHTKQSNKMINRQLNQIAKKRKEIAVTVKSDERNSVVLGKELTKLRREQIKTLVTSENRLKTTAAEKVELLAENIKCELSEKKDLIDIRIAKLEELKSKSKNPAIERRLMQQKNLSKQIEKLIINTDIIKEDNSLFAGQKLERLKIMVNHSESKSLEILKDFRMNGFDKLQSAIKHDFNQSMHDNIADRNTIRGQMTTKDSADISSALNKAIETNNKMLVKLNEQKNFISGEDSLQKNLARTNKYNHSGAALLDIQTKVIELEHKETNPERKRILLKEIKSYSESKVLPLTMQSFMKDIHQQAVTYINEQTKAQLSANKQATNQRPLSQEHSRITPSRK